MPSPLRMLQEYGQSVWLDFVSRDLLKSGGLASLIAEDGLRGVTSNTVCPAYVRTPLVENQIADQARTHGIAEAEVVEKIMLTEPAIKRLIEPAEVAAAVAYLCSEAASFVNGSSLVLDGGWSAR